MASKTPIQGMVRAGATSIQAAYLTHISAITVYVDWTDLQDTNTTTLSGPDVAVVDNALSYAATNSIDVKLRLFTGGKHGTSGVTAAPTWLVAQVGTFGSTDPQDAGAPTQIARYWRPQFLTAYDKLMELMAARWDADARMKDITISGAMTKYAEPFIHGVSKPQNRAELVGGGIGYAGTNIPVPGAGYTEALNIAAHKSFIDSHARWWTTTNSSLAFNPYQQITSYSQFNSNYFPSLQDIMSYFKTTLGGRGVLENNSVRPDYFVYNPSGNATGFSNTVPSYTQMYQEIQTYPPPYFFQTANSTQIANPTYPNVGVAFERTMNAIDLVLEGNACEPPTDYASRAEPEFSPTNFEAWDNALKANPLGSGGGGGGAGGTVLFADTFTRTVSGGWGALSTPGSTTGWTVLTGTAADFSVATGEGGQTLPASSSVHRVGAGISLADVDIAIKVGWDAVPFAASLQSYVIARYADTNNFYRVFTQLLSSSAMQAKITKTVAGVGSDLSTAAVVVASYVAGDFYWVRLQVQGSSVRYRVWKDGTTEPAAWDATATDTSITAAGDVVMGTLNGATGSTHLFSFDLLTAKNFTAAVSVPKSGTDQILVSTETSTVTRSGAAIINKSGTDTLTVTTETGSIVTSGGSTAGSGGTKRKWPKRS